MNIENDDGWIRDGHKISLVLDQDVIEVKLLHPESALCQNPVCYTCMGEAEVNQGPFPEEPVYRRVACDDCQGTGKDRSVACWLQTYWDNLMPMEMYCIEGRTELGDQSHPFPIAYRSLGIDEGPEWKVDLT